MTSCGGSTISLTWTAATIADDEANAALPKLRAYPGLEKLEYKNLPKFLVRDDGTPKGRVKYDITSCAIGDSESLFGRSTVGYIGYDIETTILVYLKDFWRTDLPEIEKEGGVYRELHSAQVSNILGSRATFPGRRTAWITRRLSENEDPGHYRLVLETLGWPLTTFKSTRQLCEVIRDAIMHDTFLLPLS